ncbi:Glyoxalase/Bleomycin resistance protein/Dihydroxybiphenyl dioxygenase [Lipomyces orientalis]|uniref:Glyoxalase/Bleomycin resistance protein/Dihydroxybiphenyl dioxygenase n=1 Tax=Lipomyces orientalis TaxID=1233043 RepID=A0ACC3TMW6_9ASCO
MSFRVCSLDHLVLTVRSIPATIEFYTRHLGMTAETFTSPSDPTVQRHALLFGPHKINLHQVGREFEPKAERPTPGSADLCLLTVTPLQQAREQVLAGGIEVLEEGKILDRTGARGRIKSFYISDPDGNLIEISTYA